MWLIVPGDNYVRVDRQGLRKAGCADVDSVLGTLDSCVAVVFAEVLSIRREPNHA